MENNIQNLTDQIDLNIFKCKNVKTPAKSWAAAGWDLFVPEDLSIFDFMKTYKMYLDESVKYQKNYQYTVPLVFYLTSPTTKEFRCEIQLKWNSNNNQWDFYIMNDEIIDGISINETENELIKWLNEKTTVITKIEMHAHSKVNIPSGIHVNLPDNVFLKVDNKSGISSKRGLSVLANIIDTDYMGEIHLNLVNTSDLSVFISAGEKIVQAIPLFQPKMNDVTVYDSLDLLYKYKQSDRGEGGFGSSGEK